MASYRSRLLEEMSDNSILGISSLSLRDDDADNGGAVALIASMRPTMTSEFHNSYSESSELMQVCGASTTPRRSNRLRSNASRPANPASAENILQGIRTDLNLPLQNRNQNLNSNGRMNLTGPDMHLVMGPSVMERGYIPTIQNYPQIDINDLFGKKDIKKNNKDPEANNKNKINANETSLNETGRDLFAKLEEALKRVSKLEHDLSEKDRDISEKDCKIQEFQNWRTCKVCMQEEVDQVFIPCGHVICCKICITQLQTCPICRKAIDNTLLAYFS